MSATAVVGIPSPPRDRAFVIAFAAAVLLHIAPFWAASIHPLVDMPGHLAVARIFHDLEDPASHFHQWFTRRPELTPYVGYYWFVDALGHLVGIETASRVYLTIYGALFPLATLALVRAFGRSRWLVFLAMPFAYPYVFYMGFLPYMTSAALAILGAGLWAMRMQGRFRGIAADAVLLVLPFLALANHPHGFLFLVCAAAVSIAVFDGPRVRSALLLAPSVAAFLVWTATLDDSSGTTAPWDANWLPVATKLALLTRNTLSQFRDPFDRWLFDAIAALWVVCVAFAFGRLALSRWRGESPPFTLRAEFALLLVVAGGVGGYLLMPVGIEKGRVSHLFVYERFLPFAMAGLAAWVPLARMPRALAALALSFALVNGAYVTWRFVSFDREMRGYRELAAQVEEGSCVAQLYPAIRSETMRGYQVFNHASQYLTLWRGTLPCFPFAVGFQMPIAMKLPDGSIAPSKIEIAPHYPLVTWENESAMIAGGTLLDTYGGFYRYFLIPRDFPLEDMFGPEDAKKVTALGKGGPFKLVLNPAGSCGRR